MREVATEDRRLWRQVLIATAFGVLAGFTAGRAASVAAHAQGACPIESNVVFTNNADSIQDTDDGVNEDNRWKMLGGRDFGRSLACNDGGLLNRFEGQGENDDVGGGSGSDYVDGGDNNDMVFGGTDNGAFGPDHLYGGNGSDTIQDDQSNDYDDASGGNGNDVINVLDGDGNDAARGDAGTDTCTTDIGDFESSCES